MQDPILLSICAIVLCLLIALIARSVMDPIEKHTIVSATYKEGKYPKDGVLTVHFSNESTAQYYGSSTVWHHYPMMVRCDSDIETKLSEIWRYIEEHGNPYPFAHEIV